MEGKSETSLRANEASRQRHDQIEELLLGHPLTPFPGPPPYRNVRKALELLLEESVVQAQRLEMLEREVFDG